MSTLSTLLNIKVTGGINYILENNTLILEMSKSGITANMQSNEAAFEAWALLAKAKGQGITEVKLSDTTEGLNNGHYNRFLYRALRFSEAFEWFRLTDELSKRANSFNDILLGQTLKLNVPKNAASITAAHAEARAERFFADDSNREELNKLLGVNTVRYYHQLPVGLFRDEVKSDTRLFPGGSAAIDLWGVDGDVFNLIELKAEVNDKLGVISQLFFYSCFVYDMYCAKKATPQKESRHRGYAELVKADIKSVRSYILTEKRHPHIGAAFGELKKHRLPHINFADVVTYKLPENTE